MATLYRIDSRYRSDYNCAVLKAIEKTLSFERYTNGVSGFRDNANGLFEACGFRFVHKGTSCGRFIIVFAPPVRVNLAEIKEAAEKYERGLLIKWPEGIERLGKEVETERMIRSMSLMKDERLAWTKWMVSRFSYHDYVSHVENVLAVENGMNPTCAHIVYYDDGPVLIGGGCESSKIPLGSQRGREVFLEEAFNTLVESGKIEIKDQFGVKIGPKEYLAFG